MDRYLFTSESVTEGHPDKICDQISDAVLDALIKKDPYSRVACETLATTGLIMVVGEITTDAYVDIPKIARDTLGGIGYVSADQGIGASTCAVLTSIDEQSSDIAMGVNEALEIKNKSGEFEDERDLIGAGDQGMMVGYACTETEELMPLPIMMAHKICMRLTKLRKRKTLSYLRPDGKSQVTVEYEKGVPKRIDTVVVSSQHSPDVELAVLREDIIEEVIKKVLPPELVDKDTKYFINPTGRFVLGGPHADAGLTGRKIIVDTYGGMASHGGGAFSGKDPTKVDRTGAYAARWIAKNIVAAGLADKCNIQVAYAIGVAHPVSIMLDTYGTGTVSDRSILNAVKEVFDLRPGSLIRNLDLRRPIFQNTAAYGHFGRTGEGFTWEDTSLKDKLREIAK